MAFSDDNTFNTIKKVDWHYEITEEYGALTAEQMRDNVRSFYNFFKINNYSITIEALAGLLGNIAIKGQFNPGQIEQTTRERKGYGFIQWTPSTKQYEQGYHPLLTWCLENSLTWYDGNAQCWRIICEGEQTNGAEGYFYRNPPYNYSWADFCKIKDVSLATKAYLYERERAGVEVESKRISAAKIWYEYLLKISGIESPSNGNSGLPEDNPEIPEDTFAAWNDPNKRIEIIGNSNLEKYWESCQEGGQGLNLCVPRRRRPEKAEWVFDYSKYPAIANSHTVLPNCTGYAWGRAYYLMGTAPKLSTSNAREWYLKTSDGYERSESVPKLGAIVCWGNTGTAGHVAVVEQINRNPDGTLESIVISESGFSTGFGHAPYYYTIRTINASHLEKGVLSSGSEFQGYIYLPNVGNGDYISSIIPQPVLDSPEFIRISDTKVKLFAKIISGSTHADTDYNFTISCTCTELSADGEITNKVVKTDNYTIVDDDKYYFELSGLTPNTTYSLIVAATASSDSASSTGTSDSVIFKTQQSLPKPVKNVQLKNLGTLNLPNSKFILSFDPLETDADWGYWQDKAVSKDYRLSLISNGRILKSITIASTTFEFTPANVLGYSLKTGETLQIGIETFLNLPVTGLDYRIEGEELKSAIICSNAIYLREEDFRVYLKH